MRVQIVYTVYTVALIHKSLAFGQSLWVHLPGLFSINTARVWYLCRWYTPTWKPFKQLLHPCTQRKGRWVSHVKNMCFLNACLCECCCYVERCVSVWVCVYLSDAWAGARSEGVRQAWTQPQTPCSFPLSGSMWMWGDTLVVSSFAGVAKLLATVLSRNGSR